VNDVQSELGISLRMQINCDTLDPDLG